MIDGTIIRVHHHGAGAEGGLKIRPLAPVPWGIRIWLFSIRPHNSHRNARDDPLAGLARTESRLGLTGRYRRHRSHWGELSLRIRHHRRSLFGRRDWARHRWTDAVAERPSGINPSFLLSLRGPKRSSADRPSVVAAPDAYRRLLRQVAVCDATSTDGNRTDRTIVSPTASQEWTTSGPKAT